MAERDSHVERHDPCSAYKDVRDACICRHSDALDMNCTY
jgi:hypothetical protein